MGVMPVGKLLANMSIPMMLSMLVQACYNIVDSIFVAQISENALNAVSLAFPLQSLMIALASGTGVGMSALLSRSLGAKDQERVSRVANTSIFLYFCTMVVFSLIGIFLSRPFFAIQTDVSEIVEYGVDYTSIVLGCSFGIFIQFCFERQLQATGRTLITMCTQMIGAVLNIILDPILIFGLFGAPKMGVAGAAIATVTGQIIAGFVAMYFCLKKNPEVKLSMKKIRWHGETARGIYRIAIPSIIMQSIGSIMTFGLNQILIAFSTTATAVLGVYFKLQSFIFMPIFGLNNGMVPIVSYNYGARNEKRVKDTIKISIGAAMSIMLVGTLIMEFFPELLLSFFQASDHMLEIGVPALRIIASHFLIAGFCILSGSVCQAIGNPLYSMFNSMCRQLIVLLPAAWLLAQTGRLELVWLAFPIAEVVSGCLNIYLLKKTIKKANAVMRGETAK